LSTKAHLPLQEAKRTLRSAGRRVTRQREAILEIIREAPGHLGADEVFQLARQRGHRLSLSTVYRTLDLLKQEGLVEEAHLQEDHRHYKVAQGDEHHHLVCLNCGKVIEFSSRHISRMVTDLEKSHGFAVTGVNLEVGGYCPTCTASERASTNGSGGA